MNTLAEGINALVESVPEGYDLEEFSRLVIQLDAAVLSGKASAPFVLGGLRAILNGALLSRDFPVWKTLRVKSSDRTWEAYSRRLSGMRNNTRLLPIFYSRTPEALFNKTGDLDADLVRVKPFDLGFYQKERIRRTSMYERARELGLKKAWPEIGLVLRLAYADQPAGEWLTIATDDVHNPDASAHLVRLGCAVDGRPIIDSIVSGKFVRCDEEFVFIKPRAGAA